MLYRLDFDTCVFLVVANAVERVNGRFQPVENLCKAWVIR